MGRRGAEAQPGVGDGVGAKPDAETADRMRRAIVMENVGARREGSACSSLPVSPSRSTRRARTSSPPSRRRNSTGPGTPPRISGDRCLASRGSLPGDRSYSAPHPRHCMVPGVWYVAAILALHREGAWKDSLAPPLPGWTRHISIPGRDKSANYDPRRGASAGVYTCCYRGIRRVSKRRRDNRCRIRGIRPLCLSRRMLYGVRRGERRAGAITRTVDEAINN